MKRGNTSWTLTNQFLAFFFPKFFSFPFISPSSPLLINPFEPLMVCYVYSGIQGDVGLPGPSGTPGDGSLRSEKILTIYKGEKVTEQGKDRSEGCSTLTSHTCVHTHTHTHPDVMGFIKIIRKRSSDCSKLYSRGGNALAQKRRRRPRSEVEKRLVPLSPGLDPVL